MGLRQRSIFFVLPAFLLSLASPLSASTQAAPVAASAPVEGLDAESGAYAKSLIVLAGERGLDRDPYWRILLHYRSRRLGGVKSELTATGFFNAPDGRTDPRAELEATIRAFLAADPTGSGVQHPQCRFPDRYRWLKDRLGIDPRRIRERPCPELQAWRRGLDPESATVIFAAAYMNNPSSAMGHSMLRLNHRGHSGSDRLLDYGVNYAANPSTGNALLYGLLGLTGGFDGIFSTVPYFVKVAEYSDLDSRDLWEYELSLAPGQLDRMMLHLWAVGHFPTAYYFFDLNCSYMILTLLDAADPELRLAQEYDRAPWVIPVNTIRLLKTRPGLIRSVELRPALTDRIRKRLDLLDGGERSIFGRLVSASVGDESSAVLARVRELPAERRARLVDAALEYLRYRKLAGKNRLEPREASLQTELLLQRSELDVKAIEPVFTADEVAARRPDVGAGSTRVSFGGGYIDSSGAFGQLGFRPTFHDVNAANEGYLRGSQIEAFSLDLRYNPALAGAVRVEHATLLDLKALTPWDPLFRKISWSARLVAEPVRDIDAGDRLEYKGDVGGGLTFELASPWLAYALAKAELGLSPSYDPGYRLGPAAELGTLVNLTPRLSALVSASYHRPLLGFTSPYFQGSAEARLSVSDTFEIRAGYDRYAVASQGRIGLNVYY